MKNGTLVSKKVKGKIQFGTVSYVSVDNIHVWVVWNGKIRSTRNKKKYITVI